MGNLNLAFIYLNQEQKIQESEVRDSSSPLLSMVYSSLEDSMSLRQDPIRTLIIIISK